MRITSAPSWARCSPQDGPAMNDAASTTRRPVSGSGIVRRRDQRRERSAEELAVVAAGEGRDEEDFAWPLVGGEALSGVGEDRRCVDPAALTAHDEGGDDIDVGAQADLGDGDFGDAGTVRQRRFDLERRYAVAA